MADMGACGSKHVSVEAKGKGCDERSVSRMVITIRLGGKMAFAGEDTADLRIRENSKKSY